VPWLMTDGVNVDWLHPSARESLLTDFFSRFAQECNHALGLHQIALGIGNRAIEVPGMCFLQKYHAGGLMIILGAFHLQMLSGENAFGFVEFQCFTVENSMIQGEATHQTQVRRDPTQLALELFSDADEFFDEKRVDVTRKYAQRCVAQPRNPEASQTVHHERRLRIDSARYLRYVFRDRTFLACHSPAFIFRVLSVQAVVFDFHVRALFASIPRAKSDDDRLAENRLSGGPATAFQDALQVLSMLCDVFSDYCSIPQTRLGQGRQPATCLLNVGMSVQLNPAKVASPHEVFRFLELHAHRYGFVNIRSAGSCSFVVESWHFSDSVFSDALVVPVETFGSFLRGRMSFVEHDFTAIVLPEFSSRVDSLHLRMFILQVPVDSDTQMSSDSTCLASALAALSDMFDHTVHRWAVHVGVRFRLF
jgi:hypothetical protein